jgi:16S rRNA (guanine527-N7)-methyltransferase
MITENKKKLAELVRVWGLAPKQEKQLSLYVRLIEEWSRRVNLVSRNDLPRIVSRHITDSFEFCRAIEFRDGAAVLDLGSGGGFPGVPIKILRPSLQMTLLDSKRIKSLFLQEVIEKLALEGTASLWRRVEEMNEALYASRFNVVVSRAVARLQTLWEWSLPLLKQDGLLAVQKGGETEAEMKELTDCFDDVRTSSYACHQANSDGDVLQKIILVSRR